MVDKKKIISLNEEAINRLTGKPPLPPEEARALVSLISQAPRPVTFRPEYLPQESPEQGSIDTTGIKELFSKLNSNSENTTSILSPRKITVKGVFFRGHLLYPGWWTRTDENTLLHSGDWVGGEGEVANIRRWLNAGFEKWGPSWDIWNPKDKKQFLFGQIGDGNSDESDSLQVIIAPKKAAKLRSEMQGNIATNVIARGTLYHDRHVRKVMSPRAQIALDIATHHGSEQMSYFVVINDIEPDGSKSHDFIDIDTTPSQPDIYSAYMWQCLIREQDKSSGLAGDASLTKVIFIWEHTNLLCKDTVNFHYKSLRSKKLYLEKLSDGGRLNILQHSFSVEEVLGEELESPLVDQTRLRYHLTGINEQISARVYEFSGRKPES